MKSAVKTRITVKEAVAAAIIQWRCRRFCDSSRRFSASLTAPRALEKEQAHRDSRSNPGNSPNPGLQAFGRKFHGAQNQRQLHAFAQDHKEYKEKNPPAGGLPGPDGVRFHLFLNLFPQVARN